MYDVSSSPLKAAGSVSGRVLALSWATCAGLGWSPAAELAAAVIAEGEGHRAGGWVEKAVVWLPLLPCPRISSIKLLVGQQPGPSLFTSGHGCHQELLEQEQGQQPSQGQTGADPAMARCHSRGTHELLLWFLLWVCWFFLKL